MSASMWTKENLEVLAARYHAEGGAAMAAHFKVSPATIRQAAHRYLPSYKPAVNQQYFDKWSSGMAYTLGYTWADGHVTKDGYSLQFECMEDDEDIIQQIREDMQSTQTVYRRTRKDKRGWVTKPVVSFHVNSKLLVTSLRERHGIPSRKTYLDCPFPLVPADSLSDFVRGYTDGDGCITCRRESGYWSYILSGSRAFLDGLQKAISGSLQIETRTVHGPQKNTYSAVWGRKSDLLLIHAWLYPASRSFLSGRRKRLLWERMKSDYTPSQIKDSYTP